MLAIRQETPVVQPVIPPGTSSAVHQTFLNVEEAIEAKDFAKAAELFKLLPKRDITVWFDAQSLPAEKRSMASNAIKQALDQWRIIDEKLKFTLVNKGPAEIKVTFSDDVGQNEDGLPKGAAFLYSSEPTESRLEAIISTKRGKPAAPVLPIEIQNEVLFAVSSYFGTPEAVRLGGANGRSDLGGLGMFRVGSSEALHYGRIMAAVDQLNLAIEKKKSFAVARPQLTLEATNIVMEPATQGDAPEYEFLVTNNGNAPLTLRGEIDCSCLIPDVPTYIEPGKSAKIRIGVNTYDFIGKVRKVLRLLSNDPDFPARDVNVAIDVKPLYRVIRSKGQLVEMSDGGSSTEFFVELDEKAPFKVTEVIVDGLKADATFEPWSGTLKDPEAGDTAERKGVLVKVNFPDQTVVGRMPISIRVITDSDNPRFKVLRANFEIQKGIVSLPLEVYFGTFPQGEYRAFAYISRPSRPFKILKIESSSPFVSGVVYQRSESEYRLDVVYNGKADVGQLRGYLTLKLDDPNQKELIVPFRGTIQ